MQRKWFWNLQFLERALTIRRCPTPEPTPEPRPKEQQASHGYVNLLMASQDTHSALTTRWESALELPTKTTPLSKYLGQTSHAKIFRDCCMGECVYAWNDEMFVSVSPCKCENALAWSWVRGDMQRAYVMVDGIVDFPIGLSNRSVTWWRTSAAPVATAVADAGGAP